MVVEGTTPVARGTQHQPHSQGLHVPGIHNIFIELGAPQVLQAVSVLITAQACTSPGTGTGTYGCGCGRLGTAAGTATTTATTTATATATASTTTTKASEGTESATGFTATTTTTTTTGAAAAAAATHTCTGRSGSRAAGHTIWHKITMHSKVQQSVQCICQQGRVRKLGPAIRVKDVKQAAGH
jgi:hypothetical protein